MFWCSETLGITSIGDRFLLRPPEGGDSLELLINARVSRRIGLEGKFMSDLCTG